MLDQSVLMSAENCKASPEVVVKAISKASSSKTKEVSDEMQRIDLHEVGPQSGFIHKLGGCSLTKFGY